MKSERGRHWVESVRGARQVREPLTFLRRQFQRDQDGSFVLRKSGLRVVLRLGTGDIVMLNQIFRRGVYEFPAPITERLDSRRETLRVLDLGGNIGLFAIFVFGRYPCANVLSVEPDPANAAMLARCMEANRAHDRWELIEACASNGDGHTEFAPGGFYESHILPGPRTGSITVPQLDFFRLAEGFDFIKIDIEGAEWRILCDERLDSLSAPMIVLEWHERYAPGSEPWRIASRRLAGAGYAVARQFSDDPTCGMIWAWRGD